MLAGLAVAAFAVHAAPPPPIQFDVFLGYDGVVPEASWMPVVFEIKNDGPSFSGVIELSGSATGSGQVRQVPIELPTGTLKRIILPLFCASVGLETWDAQLLDDRRRLRAEQTGVRGNRNVCQGIPLIGALPRTPGGTPQIRAIQSNRRELQPTAARLMPQLVPDNPLLFEGLTGLYLNSERASELSPAQVRAMLGWVRGGGHLIFAVEQGVDIAALAWAKEVLPFEVRGFKTLATHPELEAWLKSEPWQPGAPSFRPLPSYGYPSRPHSTANPFGNLPPDEDFENAPVQAAVGQMHRGKVEVASGDTPLIVNADYGLGGVTMLLFSPEREPMRSWKNLSVFWAKLSGTPAYLYLSSDFNRYGGWSTDSIFGAMIDSRQVHKLPLGWLLFMLTVYLAVIGPLDYYWLKRIARPMLTWITFPCYVALFSLVIYLIGYKLRAGESEWNELHVVDVVASGAMSELRGRSFVSVYAPANETHVVSGQERYAMLRGETGAAWGRGSRGLKATLVHEGDKYTAKISVPVWKNELFVHEWWERAVTPLQAKIEPSGTGGIRIRIENRSRQRLTHLKLAASGQLFDLGEIGAGEEKVLTASGGIQLGSLIARSMSGFQSAVSSRQYAFAGRDSGRIDDLPGAAAAVSFLSLGESDSRHQHLNFLPPRGLDLAPLIRRGDAVLLAWTEDFSPANRLHQYSPKRFKQRTLWRVPLLPN